MPDPKSASFTDSVPAAPAGPRAGIVRPAVQAEGQKADAPKSGAHASDAPTPVTPLTPEATAPQVSAYPDDLAQNALDRARPPIHEAAAAPEVTDHARQHQGGGTTGEVGGDRPAEASSSALSPIDGHDVLPGPDAAARGEIHWDAALPEPVHISAGAPFEIGTLAQAGAFLSGRRMTLDTSAALQETALTVVAAARSGTREDLARAGRALFAYVRMMRLDQPLSS